MACLSRCSAVVGLSMLALFADASFVPRPLTDYESTEPAAGSLPGVRRFQHHEVHQFDDGTDLELQWEVDADPESILAVDLEHPRGVRVHECRADRLTLHVSREHAPRVARWRHVTASKLLHGCSHLKGYHLYHQVVKVEDVRNHSHNSGIAVVQLATKELASVSEVFPHCRYYFSFVPVQAKEPSNRPQPSQESKERRLFFSGSPSGSSPTVQNSFAPSDNSHASLLNLDVPKQLSNIGYNWNYDASSPSNPQFKYTFPGGLGYMRLYQPYLKAHFSLNINFTSDISNMGQPPDVSVSAELQGFADFNIDVATAVNFDKEKSSGVLNDVLKSLDLPGLNQTTSDDGATQGTLNSIKFYFGGTPLEITPGFSCTLKAYHIGLLKGSLRVALASNILMKGVMTFDSGIGLLTNFSALAQHINFTAPTWMLFTQHFELGMMLEPTFFLQGGFGSMKNMQMGMSVRPYFNVSIMQENPAALGGDTSAVAELAIYPFRAVGLPPGGSYAIQVGANGQNKTTALKFSTGVAEFNDNVQDWEFGTISQTALLTVPIQVSILQNGQAVATGQAVCSSVVNGMCKPGPVTATMQLSGQTVQVHLSVVWDQNALSNLMSQIKGVALRFPTVSVSSAISQQLAAPGAMSSAELRVTRNGRTYSVPLASKDNSSALLQSRVIYELGPCFLESWQTEVGSSKTQDMVTPKLELVLAGNVVGTGSMPTVQWDKSTTLKAASSLASSIASQLRTIPVMVPLYPPSGGTELVGTGEIEIDVLPAQLSAFWVYPYQSEDLAVGSTYKLYWALVNGQQGQSKAFTLTAMQVGQDGSLSPTQWQQSLTASCVVDTSVNVTRYAGGVHPCLYSYDLSVPSSLANQQVVIVASWVGQSLSAPQWMVSTPIKCTSGRRLQTTQNKGQWGRQSLGATNSTTYGKKVQSKLHKLASHCSAQPLKYSISAGMNAVQMMKNVILPMGAMMGGMGDRPDWRSKPIPLMQPLGNGNHGGRLKDILPKILCSGGVCEGMMPGCNHTKTNPLVIKKINVQLSRLFRWKEHFGPKLRHAIAYGLALAPSAIQIGQNQAGGRRLHVEPEAPAEEVGRWVVEKDDGLDHELGDAEFESFDVHFTEPIHYEPTDALLETFRRRGAFNGLSDGREATHGPVRVLALRVLPDALPASEALYDATDRLGEAGAPGRAAGRQSRTYQVTATSIACMALLGTALVVTRAAVRRRGYTLVDPPDALGDLRLFA